MAIQKKQWIDRYSDVNFIVQNFARELTIQQQVVLTSEVLRLIGHVRLEAIDVASTVAVDFMRENWK